MTGNGDIIPKGCLIIGGILILIGIGAVIVFLINLI